jgi:galactose-1-phosphate uridylyltransferase
MSRSLPLLAPSSGRVAHAFGTSLPGRLVVVPRRHVIALDELTAGEAADLGPLLRALTAAMRAVLGCSKTSARLCGWAHDRVRTG